MKKNAVRFLALIAALILLMSTAAAEWRKESSGTWRYYRNGNPVTDFAGTGYMEIPDSVDKLERDAFLHASRKFYIICNPGSYAEKYAKQYGFQYKYKDGTKNVTGYQITDLKKKANWIIDNYVVDNYKGKKLTDQETALVLHNWLTTNAAYDVYGLNLDETGKREQRLIERPNMHEAEGVIVDGIGVCESYARAYTYLLNMADIPSRFIVGDTTSNKKDADHAWSMVLIDGQWYFVDVTWDDPGVDPSPNAPAISGVEGDANFMITDKELRKLVTNDAPRRIWNETISADRNQAGFVVTKDGTFYYDGSRDEAAVATGWIQVKHDKSYADWYYVVYDPNTNTLRSEREGKYYFKEDKKDSEKNGLMAVGWEDISNNRYFFDDDGLMHTGWLDAEDGKYHFSDTGVMDTGKTDLMTNYRQLNPDTKVWEDKTGLMTYIFDQDGRMLADRFVSADGKTYHIDRYGWVEKDRWVEVDNDKYHARKDGSLDKGMTDFVYEGNTYTYFFDDEGKMQTGFVDTKGNTYYLNEYGVMEKGRWVKVDSDLYHAQKSGALDKGLTDIANGSRIYTYYFDEKGKMQTGFVEADGERYHMDENGVMEKNVWVKDGKDRYHMGADGTADTGWQTIDRENYYFDTDGSLYDRTPGDLNDDNRVDGRDAIHLMKWLAGDEVEEDTPFCANGDVDHDKEVDEHDLLRMMKYFGGEKVDLE